MSPLNVETIPWIVQNLIDAYLLRNGSMHVQSIDLYRVRRSVGVGSIPALPGSVLVEINYITWQPGVSSQK